MSARAQEQGDTRSCGFTRHAPCLPYLTAESPTRWALRVGDGPEPPGKRRHDRVGGGHHVRPAIERGQDQRVYRRVLAQGGHGIGRPVLELFRRCREHVQRVLGIEPEAAL